MLLVLENYRSARRRGAFATCFQYFKTKKQYIITVSDCINGVFFVLYLKSYFLLPIVERYKPYSVPPDIRNCAPSLGTIGLELAKNCNPNLYCYQDF